MFVLPKEKIFVKSPCKWSLISVYISKSFFLPSRVSLREEQNHYGSIGCFPDVSEKPAKFLGFIVSGAEIRFCVCHVIS